MLKSKMQFVSTLVLLTLVGLFLGSTPPAAYAATCTSLGTASWNLVGTWSCGHVPTAADDVVIVAGHFVTLDVASATIASLTINSTGGLPPNDGTTLTVNGNVVNGGGISAPIAAFTLNINGSSCNTQATLTGNGAFASFGTMTVNVVNVDTSGFTGSVTVGAANISGTGTARTGTTNSIIYNITECVPEPVVAAVGGVAEVIVVPTTAPTTSGLEYLAGLASVVMLVSAGWVLKRKVA